MLTAFPVQGWLGRLSLHDCCHVRPVAFQPLTRQHPASLDAALSPAHLRPLPPPQYIDAISSKQGELESYVSDGYRTALTEERRRLCFLVEKQCAVAKSSAAYHSKVRRGPRQGGAHGRAGRARESGGLALSVMGVALYRASRAFQLP